MSRRLVFSEDDDGRADDRAPGALEAPPRPARVRPTLPRVSRVTDRLGLLELRLASGFTAEVRAELAPALASPEAVDPHPAWRGLARGLLAAALSIDDDAEASVWFARAADHGRVQVWAALHLALRRRTDEALARLRDPSPLADALHAVLRRAPPPTADDDAFLLWRALEAWRAGASVARIAADAEAKPTVAVRMVLSQSVCR